MEIIEYRNLDTTGVKAQYQKVIGMLEKGDFASSEVKKLTGRKIFRAKLDHTNRLLFKIGTFQQKKVALILEVIRNHNYARARFLNGAVVTDAEFEELAITNTLEDSHQEGVAYINQETKVFNFLDKIISFDKVQDKIYSMPLPLIIIGSAGSGKTALTLEKLKLATGDILYITLSEYLAKNSRDIYYAGSYINEKQNIDFLSFGEFIETIKIPDGKEITFKAFQNWFKRIRNSFKIKDEHKLFEEFKGVISGLPINTCHLSHSEYINLGIKQSIFSRDEREEVYAIYKKYLNFLKEHTLYDTNLLSHEYLSLLSPRYDFVVIDEVQDLTNIQLNLILKSLRSQEADATNFLICGDSNQIVHPNFFSWSTLKSMFYKAKGLASTDIIRILNTNYRNSPEITDIANKILKIKTARFGSVDKESHYLVTSNSHCKGNIEFFKDKASIKQELNKKTKTSTKHAIIVMRDEDKKLAREFFQSPLVFSVHEVKGLEYENIILYDFISSSVKEFNEITAGVSLNDLNSTEKHTYGRAKNKSDKSLEVYKFFINSLYVAITRSIKNLYWIESAHKHNLLHLLELNKIQEEIQLDESKSNLDDWKKEATKLELQGKQEQAEEIRRNILTTEKLPWDICTVDKFLQIKEVALEGKIWDKKVKKARQFAFEYALTYDDPLTFEELKKVGLKRAATPYKETSYVHQKYYPDTSKHNLKILQKNTNRYGVDYRNPFNETPLMCAAKFGHSQGVELLLEGGANIELRDNYGRTPLQLALAQAFSLSDGEKTDKKFLAHGAYTKILPSSVSIKVKGRLVKLDARLMENFLFHGMISLFSKIMRETPSGHLPVFTSAHFVGIFSQLPDFVLKENRKKGSYISSILANNEVDRNYKYNRFLFLRVFRGAYMLNPELEVRHGEDWINVYDLFSLGDHKNEDPDILKKIVAYIKSTR